MKTALIQVLNLLVVIPRCNPIISRLIIRIPFCELKKMRITKIISFLILLLIIGCAKEINDSRCNYLLDLDIYYEVNLNLPHDDDFGSL